MSRHATAVNCPVPGCTEGSIEIDLQWFPGYPATSREPAVEGSFQVVAVGQYGCSCDVSYNEQWRLANEAAAKYWPEPEEDRDA